MSETLYKKVLDFMQNSGFQFEETRHEPVFTSEVASKVSGHPEEQGTKSLVLQSPEGNLIVVTVCGDERIDFNIIKKIAKVKKVRMCNEDLLPNLLGTELGGVAPFGYQPGIVLVVSPRLFEQEYVHFNGGRNDITFKVRGSDFQGLMMAHHAVFLPSPPGQDSPNVGNP